MSLLKRYSGGGGSGSPLDEVFRSVSASDSNLLTDDGEMVKMNLGSAGTFTVQPNSSVAMPVGATIDILQWGIGQITVVPGAGVTINSPDGATKTRIQYSSCTLIQIATDVWLLTGDITN